MNKSRIGLSLFIVLLTASFAFSFVESSDAVTFQVSSLSEKMLILNLESGEKFTGSLAINGGPSNDINFWVTDPQGTTVVNLGRVSQGKSFEFTTQLSGAYTFHFDNKFSLLSSKTINLSYDFGLPILNSARVNRSDFGLSLFIVGVAVIIIALVGLVVVLSLRNKVSKINQPRQHVREKEKYCIVCGNRYQKTDQFCSKCGKKIVE